MKTTIKTLMLVLFANLLTNCGSVQATIEALCPATNTTGSTGTSTGGDSVLKNERADSNDDNQIFISYRAGVGYEVPLTDVLSFNPGLLLSSKGNKTATGSGNTKFENKLNLVYIDIPLVARYKIGQGNFNVFGGLQPSFLVNAKEKTKFNGRSETRKTNDQYKKFDVAAKIGAGYKFDNGFGINFGYDHGLANILSEDAGGRSFKVKNRILFLAMSYTFANKK